MRTPDAVLAFGLALLLVVGAGSISTFAQGQETTTDGSTTDASNLDLREANVVGVEFERGEDTGVYDFSVTLFHDDEGEPGYADWWQVETLNGTELGRRDLLHAHGTEPFTRSERIEVPENVSLVVVRGHDQTHGYGGQAVVVDLRTGATEAVQQGSDARNFSECEAVQTENVTAGTTTATAGTTTEISTTNATTDPTTDADLVRCPWADENETTTASG